MQSMIAMPSIWNIATEIRRDVESRDQWGNNDHLLLLRWLIGVHKSLRFRLIRHWLGFWLEVVVSNWSDRSLWDWIDCHMTGERVSVGVWHVLRLIWGCGVRWAHVRRQIHPSARRWRRSLCRAREGRHVVDLRDDHEARVLEVVRVQQLLHVWREVCGDLLLLCWWPSWRCPQRDDWGQVAHKSAQLSAILIESINQTILDWHNAGIDMRD